MEENVALDSNKQKEFAKGIRKLLKKNKNQVPSTATNSADLESTSSKSDKKKKRHRNKGLVYISHIPHGFYENEMTQYFKQFGRVTNVRVIRSKRTGRSRGFAYVEFSEPAVAQIVAETMNNYLMGKRLLKAEYIPPEKQNPFMQRLRWTPQSNPGLSVQIEKKKVHNELKTEDQEKAQTKRLLKRLNEVKKNLKKLGIDYDFFTPVDIPAA